MPFDIVHSNNGYYVENRNTHHKFSNHPLSRERAGAQLRAIYANYGRGGGELRGGGKDDFKIDDLTKKEKEYEPGFIVQLGKDLTKLSSDLVKGTVSTVEKAIHDLTQMKDKKDDSESESDEEEKKSEKSMIKKEERKIERYVEKQLEIESEIFLPVMEELSEKLFKKMGWMILARHMDKDEKVMNYKRDIKHLMKALMKLAEKTKPNTVDHERVKKLYKHLKVLHDYVEKYF
jgi:hypothetical protein